MGAVTETFRDLNEAKPRSGLLGAYEQCLSLSRQYLKDNQGKSYDDVDVDMLDEFLTVRAELFAAAENSFNALALDKPVQNGPQENNRKVITEKVVSVLEEMAMLENQLAEFLGLRLKEMKQTLNNLNQSQMVFKRYGELGGKGEARLIITQG
ncbi:MAG: hypothetical protein ACRCTY_08110 [Candidatus Adiutrix sp.]